MNGMDKLTERYFTITPIEVMMGNAERRALLEREKSEIAVEGIKRLISQAVNHSHDWNPEIEKLTASIIIEAENILREIDGRKQTKSSPRHWLYRQKNLWELSTRKVQWLLWLGKVRYMFHSAICSLKAFRFKKGSVN